MTQTKVNPELFKSKPSGNLSQFRGSFPMSRVEPLLKVLASNDFLNETWQVWQHGYKAVESISSCGLEDQRMVL
jgi:hypothetical protein